MEKSYLKGKTILVVDDEVDLRDIVSSELEFMGAEVFQADNISTAEKLLSQHKIDLVISDIRMPGGTGVDLLDKIKARNAVNPPVILITGFADITVADAFNRGVEALLSKPFKLDDLIKMVFRYTSAFEDRFKEEGVAQKDIVVVSPQVKYGRGGLTIEISTEGKRYDIGDLVEFNVDGIRGIGACRWTKAVDNFSHKALMGIEFMKIDGPSLERFKKNDALKETISYIPSSNI